MSDQSAGPDPAERIHGGDADEFIGEEAGTREGGGGFEGEHGEREEGGRRDDDAGPM